MKRYVMCPTHSYSEAADPYRRLLAGTVLRAIRDLRLSDRNLRRQALAFFDDEGVALATALGIPANKVRQVVTSEAEVMSNE